MVRYLAVSGRRISAQEMYTLGLLTHIVPDKADSALARAIAETVPDE